MVTSEAELKPALTKAPDRSLFCPRPLSPAGAGGLIGCTRCRWRCEGNPTRLGEHVPSRLTLQSGPEVTAL